VKTRSRTGLFAEHVTAAYRAKTEGRGRTVDIWKSRPEQLEPGTVRGGSIDARRGQLARMELKMRLNVSDRIAQNCERRAGKTIPELAPDSTMVLASKRAC